MELPLTNVESVASFYTMYESRPVGKHTVQVCRNVSCRLKGSGELSAWMARELGVSPGETTADGSITYSEVECLGACGGAPVVRVDEAYQENAAVKDLERVIGKLRGSGGEDR
jgi:NADH:ubiquinone oxidoreductase subunit E